MAKNTDKTEKKETATGSSKTELKVSRKDALNILTGLGFMKTVQYDNETLAERLTKLPTYMVNNENTLTGDVEEHIDKIIKALTIGTKIAVTGPEPKNAVHATKAEKDARKEVKEKAKKEKKEGTPKAKKGKKRIDSICDQIRSLPRGGLTLGQVAEAANKDFMANGGEDNVKQTLHHLNVVLPVILHFKAATMSEDEKLMPPAK